MRDQLTRIIVSVIPLIACRSESKVYLASYDMCYAFDMECFNQQWSKHEDVCVTYYASRGVFPEGVSEILNLLCRSQRHAYCIHRRVIHIQTVNELYCFSTKRYLHDRICAWFEAQDVKIFVNRLTFAHPIAAAIQQVSKIAWLRTERH